VRFQDVDAAGIVFFPRIFEYFNDAFLEFLEQGGQAAHQALREQTCGLPLRHAEADFLSPLRFGDRIEVALVDAQVEATQVAVAFRIRMLPDGAVAAVGRTLHVCVDLASFKRTEIPAELRAVLERLAARGASASTNAGPGGRIDE
jgi:1,4-dihydroxy-2-naphthoyl-CoA hydrolase